MELVYEAKDQIHSVVNCTKKFRMTTSDARISL